MKCGSRFLFLSNLDNKNSMSKYKIPAHKRRDIVVTQPTSTFSRVYYRMRHNVYILDVINLILATLGVVLALFVTEFTWEYKCLTQPETIVGCTQISNYEQRAYELFEVLLQTIGEEVTKFIAFFQLVDSTKLENANKKNSNSDLRYNDFEGNGKEATQKTSPAIWGKVGRNSQCPCGSGKKYKNCHGKN